MVHHWKGFFPFTVVEQVKFDPISLWKAELCTTKDTWLLLKMGAFSLPLRNMLYKLPHIPVS